MKKIQEQIETLSKLEHLIAAMDSEIKLLRNINYRYYLKHGDEIQNGVVKVPDSIEFGIKTENKGVQVIAKCEAIDCDKINIEGKYQKIQKYLQELAGTLHN
jgi:hypothetical protein